MKLGTLIAVVLSSPLAKYWVSSTHSREPPENTLLKWLNSLRKLFEVVPKNGPEAELGHSLSYL